MKKENNQYFSDLIAALESFNISNDLNSQIELLANLILNTTLENKLTVIFGNGGSAADAQHLAAEFLVRLKPGLNRNPIPAISLATDTSTLTACSNDYSFTKIFSRNLEALANVKDVLIIISTSGNSKNIIDVLKTSKKIKIKSIGFLGSSGGKAKKLCDHKIIFKSNDVARIQENHIFLGHFIFEQVEKILIKKK